MFRVILVEFEISHGGSILITGIVKWYKSGIFPPRNSRQAFTDITTLVAPALKLLRVEYNRLGNGTFKHSEIQPGLICQSPAISESNTKDGRKACLALHSGADSEAH